MFGDSDLDVFTADMGVPVTFTGAPVGLFGILEVADAIQADKDGLAGIIGTIQAVRVKYSAVIALRVSDPITVNGTDYTVRHRARTHDGAFQRLYLQDV